MSFMDAVGEQATWLQAWVYWMMFVNLAAIVFVKRVEARWAMAAFMAAAILMNVLFAQFGWVRLLGFGHIPFWTPLAVYLWRRRTAILDTGGVFRIWADTLLVTISLSLVADYLDVIRYFAGDRS